jgi:hypothetical protein
VRGSRAKSDRDRFVDAGQAMRRSMKRFNDARVEDGVRWSPADVRMFHVLLGYIGTYSRTWNAMSVKQMAGLSGLHVRTVTRSMSKLEDHGVIEWVRGDGRDWSEVYLRTSDVYYPTPVEGRSHVAAPRTEGEPPAGDGPGDSAAPGAVTFDPPRGGHMSPPETRRGFREVDLFEKGVTSQSTCDPSVKHESPTEQTPFDPVGDVLRDVEPMKPKPPSRRSAYRWFALDGTLVNKDGTPLEDNPAPTMPGDRLEGGT